MYVKDYMSEHLITVGRQTKILETLDLMRDNNLHRLPVVEGEKLVGLLTEGTVQEHSPSKSSSLSIHEMNYLLTKTAVDAIMIRKIITIGPDALLEQAAALMRHYNIGCLPVVVEGDKLVGIITQNDIFDAFIHLLGYYEEGCHVVVEVPEESAGILGDLGELLGKEGVNIAQVAVFRKGGPVRIVMQVEDTDSGKIEKLLAAGGHKVVSCVKKAHF